MQVDLLVQLPKCVYVIEVKRRDRIDVSVEEEVQEKIRRLPLKKGRSVKTVLVYEGELDATLEEDGFFDVATPCPVCDGVVDFQYENILNIGRFAVNTILLSPLI